MHRTGSCSEECFGDGEFAPNAGSNRRIHPDTTPTSRVVHRLLMVEKVVECGEGVRRMARFLDDKVRRKQAAMYWTRACCKQKTSMRGCRWCCHEYCLSGDRLRLCEGVCSNAVKCLNELLRQCDTPTVKTGRQPHSRVCALIPTPRINAELSEEPVERSGRRRRVSAGGNDRHLSAGPYDVGRTSEY
jgi:hypothetical protein